ncbi:MAG: hypothetical protein JST42_16850 [Bacteroidetes bacterium]|nr:hypothetical protein [Bacteroidota bacterium]
MSTTTGRKGSFLLVTFLLVIAILLEQFWLSRLFPWLGEIGRVQPMIVFLDIPLRLPVIDWIPVGAIFIILYLVVVGPELPRPHRGTILWNKGWSLFAGWWLLLLCIVAAGGLYYLAEDHLPRQVRNGIDSFGFRADIAVPLREDPIQLHGGVILLIALLIGGRAFLLRTNLSRPEPVPGPTPQLEPQPETISLKQTARSLKQTADPLRQTARRSAQEPASATSAATVRPCVVSGIVEPRSA